MPPIPAAWRANWGGGSQAGRGVCGNRGTDVDRPGRQHTTFKVSFKLDTHLFGVPHRHQITSKFMFLHFKKVKIMLDNR
jgi:hypothetical protein